MAKMTFQASHRAKNFAYLLVILFIIWLALSLNIQWQELVVGFLLSLFLAAILHHTYLDLGFPSFTVKRGMFFLAYLVVLFKEIILANLDVAYRVIHPKMPIKPGMIMIKTELKQDIAKMILANSITLTPGTFTLDIQGNTLLIHWINVKSTDIDETTEIIGKRFEKYLRVIFA